MRRPIVQVARRRRRSSACVGSRRGSARDRYLDPFVRSPRLLIVVLLGLLWIAVPASAQTPPKEVQLSDGWEFRFDATNLGLKARWGKSPEPEADWADVTVPHLFDPNPTTEKFLGTVGWYRLKFPTPATPEGFTWALNFQGARRRARVWLNGRELG